MALLYHAKGVTPKDRVVSLSMTNSSARAIILVALRRRAKRVTTVTTPPNTIPGQPSFNVHPTWEIAHNHYHNRPGYSVPKMAVVLAKIRTTGVNHQMAWETLTHAEVGAIGLPTVAQSAH
jgi:hypothetical protein